MDLNYLSSVMKVKSFDLSEIYNNTKIRVCAYCRVSTDSDAQLTSFALQREHYQNFICIAKRTLSKFNEYASQLDIETYLCGRGNIRDVIKKER